MCFCKGGPAGTQGKEPQRAGPGAPMTPVSGGIGLWSGLAETQKL